jgi:UDP-N-acetylglucosamine--N-acetylmuramyl-(pentapeptide) pyrophosphoryl-undecaprenol N-acetylglucosamine transferase
MAAAYAWADVVVCRAGALTVSEVAAAGVAALFIPFPHAVDDHQTRNAEFLVENDAALLLQESQTDARTLAKALSSLVGDRARLVSMAVRGRAAAVPDSADRVAALCREYVTS